MAYMSVSYPSFASGATISAAEFNTNFGEITDGLSDGTKAIGVGAVTAASHVDLNSTLQVASAATFSGPVYAESTFRATGGATFSGAVAFGSTVSYPSTLATTFTSAVYTDSTFRNTGGATFSGAVEMAGVLTVSATTMTPDIQSAAATFNDVATGVAVKYTMGGLTTIQFFPGGKTYGGLITELTNGLAYITVPASFAASFAMYLPVSFEISSAGTGFGFDNGNYQLGIGSSTTWHIYRSTCITSGGTPVPSLTNTMISGAYGYLSNQTITFRQD